MGVGLQCVCTVIPMVTLARMSGRYGTWIGRPIAVLDAAEFGTSAGAAQGCVASISGEGAGIAGVAGSAPSSAIRDSSSSRLAHDAGRPAERGRSCAPASPQGSPGTADSGLLRVPPLALLAGRLSRRARTLAGAFLPTAPGRTKQEVGRSRRCWLSDEGGRRVPLGGREALETRQDEGRRRPPPGLHMSSMRAGVSGGGGVDEGGRVGRERSHNAVGAGSLQIKRIACDNKGWGGEGGVEGSCGSPGGGAAGRGREGGKQRMLVGKEGREGARAGGGVVERRGEGGRGERSEVLHCCCFFTGPD